MSEVVPGGDVAGAARDVEGAYAHELEEADVFAYVPAERHVEGEAGERYAVAGDDVVGPAEEPGGGFVPRALEAVGQIGVDLEMDRDYCVEGAVDVQVDDLGSRHVVLVLGRQ